MRNVSMEFKKTMNERRDFYYTAHIDFADGRSVDLDENDLVVTGNGITESGDVSSFPLGCAIGKRITLEIRNNNDQFSEYDFYNAVIQVKLKFDLSQNTEIIDLGKYTVRDPESYGSTIAITAVDDMYKADTEFSGTGFPKTVAQAMMDCCSSCGLTMLNTEFPNNDFVIKNTPTGITNRQFFGLCAMLAGGNAVVDEYGRISFKTYDFSVFEQHEMIDGGSFDKETPYGSGDRLDGGTFYPWDEGDTADSGTFSDSDKYHVFYNCQNLAIATDDVVITGVKITKDDMTYIKGTEGYVLELENQLASGSEDDAVERIGKLIIGLRFRPFTMDHICYPMAEIGDLCYIVDRKNRCYQSVITDVDFQFRGFTVVKCSADSPQRNSSKYNTNTETKAIVASRNETKKQIGEYEKAVQIITSIMANSLGMFTTIEKTENGGEIVYQHNKPNLSESNIIWKKTENAFTVSTDGGETWNAGIDADGNVLVNVLSAVGIKFDWAKGGTLILGGENNVSGLCKVLSSKGDIIVQLGENGLFMNNPDADTDYAMLEYTGPKNGISVYPEGIAFKLKEGDAYSYNADFQLVRFSDGTSELLLHLRPKCIGVALYYDDNGVPHKTLEYLKADNSYNFSLKTIINLLYTSVIKSKKVNGVVTSYNEITIEDLINGAKNGTTAKSVTDKLNSTYTGTVKVAGTPIVNGVPMMYRTFEIENGIIKNIITTNT